MKLSAKKTSKVTTEGGKKKTKEKEKGRRSFFVVGRCLVESADHLQCCRAKNMHRERRTNHSVLRRMYGPSSKRVQHHPGHHGLHEGQDDTPVILLPADTC